ncbi:unnamed protein product [Onchocerca flexuosa]|uniref:Secreted protein n=1 Tax=Onchocerca flexuosa TaxID=387005 RepID=A0A183I0G6_9BILA|nr:unnamed protein product [Onchocerca flexuosa]
MPALCLGIIFPSFRISPIVTHYPTLFPLLTPPFLKILQQSVDEGRKEDEKWNGRIILEENRCRKEGSFPSCAKFSQTAYGHGAVRCGDAGSSLGH